MHRTQVYLTDDEHKSLIILSEKTGQSQSQLIRNAVDKLIAQSFSTNKKEAFKKAAGLWRNRRGPNLKKLRKEWDRA